MPVVNESLATIVGTSMQGVVFLPLLLEKKVLFCDLHRRLGEQSTTVCRVFAWRIFSTPSGGCVVPRRKLADLRVASANCAFPFDVAIRRFAAPRIFASVSGECFLPFIALAAFSRHFWVTSGIIFFPRLLAFPRLRSQFFKPSARTRQIRRSRSSLERPFHIAWLAAESFALV